MRDSALMNVDASQQEEAVAAEIPHDETETAEGTEQRSTSPGEQNAMPDIAEERFQVDRKKLEEMLQNSADPKTGETAEDFFQRVMEETGTQISWPAKLKIGAKSKKDPHIKISGKPEAVSGAREMILEVLDTKRNRVTLKMDVSFTDHSHIIGKGGRSIQQVMEETGCHIHFPDSNRTSATEKSNQVSIAGPTLGVERARCRIRELLPLVVTFDLPVTGFSQSVLDAPPIQLIQRTCGISVTFRQKLRGSPTTAVVRGTCTQLSSFRQGLIMLQDYLTGNNGVALPVTLSTEISPQHHSFVMGRGGCNIRLLMQQTGTTITFPEQSSPCGSTLSLNSQPMQFRKSTVTITGPFDNVYWAWQELSNLLPLVLMFDLKDGHEVDAAQITQLVEQLHIQIFIKPKPKQNSKSIVIKGHEKDSCLLFEVRRQLLNLDSSEVPVPLCSDNNSSPLTSAGLTSPNSHCNHSQNTLLKELGKSLGNGTDFASSPLLQSSPNFLNALTMNPLATMAAASLVNQQLLPPAWALNSTLLQMLVNQQIATAAATSRLGSLLQGHSPASLQQLLETAAGLAAVNTVNDLRVHTSDKGSVDTNSRTSSSSSPSLSPIESPGHCTGMHGSSGYRGSTSSLTDKDCPSPHAWTNHNWSPSSLDTSSLRRASSVKSSDLGLGSLSSVGSTCSFNSERAGAGRSYYSHSSASGSTDSLLDLKSQNPDASRTNKGFQGIYPLDYDHHKLLATKAMQSNVGTDVRVPTSVWSGFGFSKSMPDSIIRNKFAEGGVDGSNVHLENSKVTSESPCPLWNEPSPPTDKTLDMLQSRKMSNFQKDENLMFSRSNFFDSILPQSAFLMGEDVHDLPHLFSKLGLGKYIDIFQQHDVDLGAFLTMNDKDLQEMGIPYGARRKMLFAISEIAQASMPDSARGFQAAPGAERRNFKSGYDQAASPCASNNCW